MVEIRCRLISLEEFHLYVAREDRKHKDEPGMMRLDFEKKTFIEV